MRKTIWKFDVPSDDPCFSINMPVGAEILCLDKQHGVPRLWVLIAPDVVEREKRAFMIVGTGEIIGNEIVRYIGSWQMSKGNVVNIERLVWHLFERFNDLEGIND